jgi:hypothetical protein
MLLLYQAEELMRRRYERALRDGQLTADYNRAVRQSRAREALERVIQQNIHYGANQSELRRDMLSVLRRAAN